MFESRTTASTVCYSVSAEADPGLLPRLIGHLAKVGLVPARLHVTTHDGEMAVDLQVADLPAERAALLEQRFRTTVGVQWVACDRKVALAADEASLF
ncbi:hypothetical protein ACM64Y_05865 [Novispirillum sp. DQ9]|uniref:hypothetical protein n=1 Tax=Novispirillum sp. DQ9 TaxID=3398612 RepID=UPI003C7AF193